MMLKLIVGTILPAFLIAKVTKAVRWAKRTFIYIPRRNRHFQQQLTRIAAEIAPMDTAFPLLEGFQARLLPCQNQFLNRRRRPGSRALVLQVTPDRPELSFPFSAGGIPSYPPFANGCNPIAYLGAPDQIGGDRLTFYAFLDAPTRALLSRFETLFREDRLLMILIHNENDSIALLSRFADDLPDILDQIRGMLTRLTHLDTPSEFPQRLTANEPTALRGDALSAWLTRPRDRPTLTLDLPTGDAANTSEMQWVRLDLDQPLTEADWDTLCEPLYDHSKYFGTDAFAENLRHVLQHQTKKRRIQTILSLLARKEKQAEVVSVLSNLDLPGLDPMLTEIHRQNPNHPSLCLVINNRLEAQHKQPDQV